MGVVSTLIAALGAVEAPVVLLVAVVPVPEPGVDLAAFVWVVERAVPELLVDDPQPPTSTSAQQASVSGRSLFIDLDSSAWPFDQPNVRRNVSAGRTRRSAFAFTATGPICDLRRGRTSAEST